MKFLKATFQTKNSGRYYKGQSLTPASTVTQRLQYGIRIFFFVLDFLQSFFYDLITKNSEEETSENSEDLEEKIDAYVEAMVSE